jgi:hypothetical protein
MKKSRIIVLSMLLIAAFGMYAGYSYLYQKHPMIEEQSAVFIGSSEQLMEQAKIDMEMWQNKVVEITGTVVQSDEKGITLNSGIYCKMKNVEDVLATGLSIKVKGRVTGYDDLMEELKMDQTIILK